MNDANEVVLSGIFNQIVRGGFPPGSERYEVCKRATGFLNFTYRQSEELVDNQSIDCSTLVSQSHWEGALIGIPFVAESQRIAASGMSIRSEAELLPGDVLIKYASILDSPEKKWNHVGLFLGKDNEGLPWLIESTGKEGVRLSLLDDFNARGGIKRFISSEDVFAGTASVSALRLARFVPKFGRLGVRQYRKSGAERLPHRGIDIYCPVGTDVYATVAGVAEYLQDEIEGCQGVKISDGEISVNYLMLGQISVAEGQAVAVDSLLGKVGCPPHTSDIKYSPLMDANSHLHIEVVKSIGGSRESGNSLIIDDFVYFNHLYLSKVGRLGVPIAPQ